MTVKELREMLNDYEDDLLVIVNANEHGFDELHFENMSEEEISQNENDEWYYGDNGSSEAEEEVTYALLLGND